MVAEFNWQACHFQQLSAQQWYQIAALRMAIFVVEQNCPYQDLDGLDCHPQTLHLCLWRNEQHSDSLVAYLRILPPNTAYPQPSIGRVIVAASERGQGLGHQLMQRAVKLAEQYFSPPLYLSAQTHLVEYYHQHGFTPHGAGYLEDGIPHQGMLWSKTNNAD
ncbi:GNAT family N-acetyltransferase [Motilimonas eburnea]|uniref:GNAT family N-acetyltransferase n=1 Tax=Motilimonas eburnea TaxID=1737488 RepID=UPI001E3E397B|nr:GNAT family N-acetyltransferase [Motilimonas eburnea]MCE2570682.1 GNAT family N-acetyltransferase [Motilimonas eburnea]